MPLASRNYTFTYRLPAQTDGLRLKTRVQYHIQSEGQHTMLKKKYGLTSDEPYFFTVYEREVPLAGDLNAYFAQEVHDPRLACRAES